MYPVCTLRCAPSASSTYYREYVCGDRPAQAGTPRAWRNALRSSLSSLRDKNLCIIRARLFLPLCLLTSCTGPQTPPTLAEIASGQVEVVDLGYALNEQNPYWPGEGYAPFHFEILSTLEADGVYSGAFSTAERSESL